MPYTSQHNCVTKMMNRTIVEMIRSILSLGKLQKIFWGEALYTTCYLINLSPLASLKGDVVENVWTKKDVSYSYLRFYGCKAFIHVPKE